MPNTLIREQLTINLPGEPTSLDAYTVRPSGNTPCPTVIVAMELFGLNDHVRDISDRLAAQGYAVIAPNFYHRTLPAASLPFGEEGRQEGFVHLRKLTREQVLADVAAVLRVIESRPDASGRVGVLGFSMGGHIAYLTATQFPVAACACFYGGWITNTDIPMSQPEPTVTLTPGMARHDAKVVYFYGGRDHAVSAEQVKTLADALEKADVRHEIVCYPEAQHGFFCELRDTFDQQARDDAWGRVLALFESELHGETRG